MFSLLHYYENKIQNSVLRKNLSEDSLGLLRKKFHLCRIFQIIFTVATQSPKETALSTRIFIPEACSVRDYAEFKSKLLLHFYDRFLPFGVPGTQSSSKLSTALLAIR